MKKSHKIILAALAICLVVFHFTVPQKAVKGEYRIHRIERNSQDITEQLSEETLMQIKELIEHAESTRWKNPIGSFPAHRDTVILIGMDDRGQCIVSLAGSADKYDIRQRILKDGEMIWKAILELLP